MHLASPPQTDHRVGGAVFQAAQIRSLALSRAAVLAKALEIATEENRYLHVIDIYHTPLANLAASSEMAWFASEAARARFTH